MKINQNEDHSRNKHDTKKQKTSDSKSFQNDEINQNHDQTRKKKLKNKKNDEKPFTRLQPNQIDENKDHTRNKTEGTTKTKKRTPKTRFKTKKSININKNHDQTRKKKLEKNKKQTTNKNHDQTRKKKLEKNKKETSKNLPRTSLEAHNCPSMEQDNRCSTGSLRIVNRRPSMFPLICQEIQGNNRKSE
jgi:hypothetical protein